MPLPPDMKVPKVPRGQCRAKARNTGLQCKQPAIAGGFVCTRHGGSFPDVKNAARERLLRLVAPALVKLEKMLEDPELENSVLLSLIKDVLDRAGLKHQEEITVNHVHQNEVESLECLTDEELAEYVRLKKKIQEFQGEVEEFDVDGESELTGSAGLASPTPTEQDQ